MDNIGHPVLLMILVEMLEVFPIYQETDCELAVCHTYYVKI